MTKNILVFPCGTEIANEIISSLQDHKYFKLFYASSAAKSYCNYRTVKISMLPFVSDATFLDQLNTLIQENYIDFIIPAHDDVAYELAQIEDKIAANVIGQSKKINEIVRFKDVTYKYFTDKLPLAKVYVDEPKEYPVFTKPKRGQGAQNSVKLNSEEDYQRFFSHNELSDFVVMEYLSGEEFTIDCFSTKGKVLYNGARTREITSRGISVMSTLVNDTKLNQEFQKYAEIISLQLQMDGLWFYQMKFDKNNQLKLLEIAPRVSGTMMLNRARGINFVELAIYNKLGYKLGIVFNDIEISLARALVPIYKHSITYNKLYIDFDDTLFLDESRINPKLMQLIFYAKNQKKSVYLITKNKKNSLAKVLLEYGIANIFDDIFHLYEDENKVDYMSDNSLLVDDSFAEREEAILHNHYAFGIDNIDILLGNSDG